MLSGASFQQEQIHILYLRAEDCSLCIQYCKGPFRLPDVHHITQRRGEQCIVSLCVTIMSLIRKIRGILTHLTCNKCAFNQCHHIPKPLRQVLSGTQQTSRQSIPPAVLSITICGCNLKAVPLTETEHL